MGLFIGLRKVEVCGTGKGRLGIDAHPNRNSEIEERVAMSPAGEILWKHRHTHRFNTGLPTTHCRGLRNGDRS